MLKNGLLTLLFAFIPGAGQMYQGYMKRGLSLMLMCCAIGVLAMLFAPIALFLMLVFMYSFLDTLKDKRLARLLLDSHKLVGWALIAFGALIAYENIIMNLLNDVLWRWGRDSVVFRAFYLVMDRLPDVVLCVAFILCGAWLVRGPQKAGKKQAEAQEDAAGDADFQEYHAMPDAPEMTLSDDASSKEENGHDE